VSSPERIADLLRQHPVVLDVRLTGSRERGEALPLSDWDFVVDVADLQSIQRDLPGLVGSVEPLGHQWDPLSDRWNYMVMLRGPVKVDLIIELPHDIGPPWEVTAETLSALDHHFWDWTLWLAAKRSRGETDMVTDELGKMFDYLLAPLGVASPPTTIEAAIETYLLHRAASASATGADVDPEMGRQVRNAIERAG
jgi:predicted nucleotidyltransferase